MAKNRPVKGTIEHANARRRQWACIGVLLGLLTLLLLATAYINLFRTGPLRISKETTYITGPLKSNGTEVDYFAAWEQESYPANMATDENGYRLIVQHLGPPFEAEPAHFALVCTKLGLDAREIHPDMTLQDPFEFLQAYVASGDFDEALIEKLLGKDASDERVRVDEDNWMDEPDELVSEDDIYGAEEYGDEGYGYEPDPISVLNERRSQPWTTEDLPMMEAWLAENGPAIDMIAEAVRKPTFHTPLVRDDENDLLDTLPFSEAQRFRSFARALICRAYYHTGAGNIDLAIEDIISCKHLGRHMGHDGQVISLLIGIALEGMADSVGIAGSLDDRPSKEQLEQLVEELNDLPPRVALRKPLLFFRYHALDVVQATAHGKSSIDDMDLTVELPSFLRYDWSIFSGRVNEHFDTYITTGSLPVSSPARMAILTAGSRSRMVADEFASSWLSDWQFMLETERRAICVERIHRIVLAMLLYECDRGVLSPAYTADADGNPLHSWRVLLLPYLGQQKLYDKIHLDEPWDSQHNRQFHDEAVAFYQCPSAELDPGRTTYSVVVGPDAAFEGAEGKKLSSFGPKSAKMILVVERKRNVCWMDPESDITQDHAEEGINVSDGSPGGIGSHHPGGANFGLRSGAARFISETIDGEQFRQLLRGETDELP